MLVARRKGFEPLTPRFEVWCSIQLSYRRRASRSAIPSAGQARAAAGSAAKARKALCAGPVRRAGPESRI